MKYTLLVVSGAPRDPAADDERASRDHPGRVQRARRADHVAELHAGPRGAEGRCEEGLVRPAGAHRVVTGDQRVRGQQVVRPMAGLERRQNHVRASPASGGTRRRRRRRRSRRAPRRRRRRPAARRRRARRPAFPDRECRAPRAACRRRDVQDGQRLVVVEPHRERHAVVLVVHRPLRRARGRCPGSRRRGSARRDCADSRPCRRRRRRCSRRASPLPVSTSTSTSAKPTT